MGAEAVKFQFGLLQGEGMVVKTLLQCFGQGTGKRNLLRLATIFTQQQLG